MRPKGSKTVKVIAGKLSPEEALARYYQLRAAEVSVPQTTTLQPAQEATQQTSIIELKPEPPPVLAPKRPSLTVTDIKDKYIAHKTQAWRGGEFADRSLMSVKEVLPRFADAFPKAVADLTVEDFAGYRAKLLAKYKPHSLNRHVTNVRAMFAWAYRNHMIPELPHWGDSFEKPSAKVLRKHRESQRQLYGRKMFEPAQVRKLLAIADRVLLPQVDPEQEPAVDPRRRAMILLGVNCGMGNTDKVIRDAGVRALVDQGWLSPYHQYVFDAAWTPHHVASVYLADKPRWGKSVMFFLSLADCHACAAILAAAGVRCDVVHGGSDQAAQIDAFDRGELDVLLNVVVLTEGFDCPALRTVFVRPGSRGPTMQMVGRALRKHPEKPFAQVVQNAASPWPFTKIASAEAKFVLDGRGRWVRRTGATEMMTRAQTNTLLAIAQTPVTLPARLLNRGRRQRRRLPVGSEAA